MLFPFFFKLVDCQSLEQFFFAEKIAFESRYKKAFPEPSWTAQKVSLATYSQIVYQVGFVDIGETSIYNLFKSLDSNRILR